MDTMATGTVKFFSIVKGFGFVVTDGGREVYFNRASLRRDRAYDPTEGDKISFELRDAKQGPIAVHIEQDLDL